MAASLKPGDVLIQRYQIESVLGEGGMGAVYRVTDLKNLDEWALKEMSESFATQEEKDEALTCFQTEVRLLGRLRHPYLPRVTHCFSESGRYYMLMDLVKGRTLHALLQEKGRLSWDEAVPLVKQLLDVLEYLHGCDPPVIFRDLKPSNIMVCPDGSVRLIDFGIARVFNLHKSNDTSAMGTPGYAAPEQYGSAQSDARTDIYALAVTLHEMLTGDDPSLTPFSFAPLRQKCPHLPASLEAALSRALSLKPADRFASVEEFRQALLAVPVSRQAEPEPKSAHAAPPAGAVRPASVITPAPAAKPATGPAAPSAAPASPVFSVPVINLGKYTRGKKLSVIHELHGQVKGSVTSLQPWIKASPSYVKGHNVKVNILVDTSDMPPGEHFGHLSYGSERLRLDITILDTSVRWYMVLVLVLLDLFSALPYLGFISPLFLLGMCLALRGRERRMALICLSLGVVISLASACLLTALISELWPVLSDFFSPNSPIQFQDQGNTL